MKEDRKAADWPEGDCFANWQPALPGRAAGSFRQTGQAMTETLVIAIAVLPFLVAVPLIARYQDIRQATQAASRTVGFECAVRGDYCSDPQNQAEITRQVRRRHFSRQDMDLHSHDEASDASIEQDAHRFWRDRKGQPLIASFDDVSVAIRRQDADALANGHREAAGQQQAAQHSGSRQQTTAEASPRQRGLVALGRALSHAVGPDAFGMSLSGGLLSASVQASVPLDERMQRVLAGIQGRDAGRALGFASKTVVLSDSWNASSPKGSESSSVRNRVAQGRRLPSLQRLSRVTGELMGSAPAELFGALPAADPEDAFRLLYKPMETVITMSADQRFLAPGGRAFNHYEVDVEVVPEDRLKKK